jgi:hypothetical protein
MRKLYIDRMKFLYSGETRCSHLALERSIFGVFVAMDTLCLISFYQIYGYDSWELSDRFIVVNTVLRQLTKCIGGQALDRWLW